MAHISLETRYRNMFALSWPVFHISINVHWKPLLSAFKIGTRIDITKLKAAVMLHQNPGHIAFFGEIKSS